MKNEKMNLDETIKYAKEQAEELRKIAAECEEYSNRKIDKVMGLDKIHKKDMQSLINEAENYEQLIIWLEELKEFKQNK